MHRCQLFGLYAGLNVIMKYRYAQSYSNDLRARTNLFDYKILRSQIEFCHHPCLQQNLDLPYYMAPVVTHPFTRRKIVVGYLHPSAKLPVPTFWEVVNNALVQDIMQLESHNITAISSVIQVQ